MEHKMWDVGWTSGYYRAIEDHVSPHDPERGKEILSGELFPPPVRSDLIVQPTLEPTEPGWYWWRDSDRDEWEPLKLYRHNDTLSGMPEGYAGPQIIGILQGQWFPIEEPE